MLSKGVPASECLQKNCLVSSNVLVKDFARWYCKSRSSWLALKPNLKSVQKNILKKFFAGFQRITKAEISDEKYGFLLLKSPIHVYQYEMPIPRGSAILSLNLTQECILSLCPLYLTLL